MANLDSCSPIERRFGQGKEPKDFMRLFGGQILVHKGFESVGKEKIMYHVRGTPDCCRAIQLDSVLKVECTTLNSRDSFVISIPGDAHYVWIGSSCQLEPKDLALSVASLLQEKCKHDVKEVPEGSEPESLWVGLDGKIEYADSSNLREHHPHHPSRLFQCSEATGSFQAVEVHNYGQGDLNEDDVMLLDLYHTVFVWQGSNASLLEKEKAFQTAQEYVHKVLDGRPEDTQIVVIESGHEPLLFTSHFLAWRSKKPKQFSDPLHKRKKYNPVVALKDRHKQGPNKLARTGSVFFLSALYTRRNLMSDEYRDDDTTPTGSPGAHDRSTDRNDSENEEKEHLPKKQLVFSSVVERAVLPLRTEPVDVNMETEEPKDVDNIIEVLVESLSPPILPYVEETTSVAESAPPLIHGDVEGVVTESTILPTQLVDVETVTPVSPSQPMVIKKKRRRIRRRKSSDVYMKETLKEEGVEEETLKEGGFEEDTPKKEGVEEETPKKGGVEEETPKKGDVVQEIEVTEHEEVDNSENKDEQANVVDGEVVNIEEVINGGKGDEENIEVPDGDGVNDEVQKYVPPKKPKIRRYTMDPKVKWAFVIDDNVDEEGDVEIVSFPELGQNQKDLTKKKKKKRKSKRRQSITSEGDKEVEGGEPEMENDEVVTSVVNTGEEEEEEDYVKVSNNPPSKEESTVMESDIVDEEKKCRKQILLMVM